MSKADDVAAVTVGTTTEYDLQRPLRDGPTWPNPSTPINLWGAIKRVLHEATYYMPYEMGDELRRKTAPENNPFGKGVRYDSNTGFSRDAASWGLDNNKQGRDIQQKLDRVLRNQKRIGDALKIEGIE